MIKISSIRSTFSKHSTEMKEIFNIRCNPEEFKGIRLSKGSGGSYGDMMQVYFFEQKTIEMILDAYFAQLYIDEKKKD